MFLDTYTSILSIYTQIEYSPIINTVLNLSTMIIRTILSLLILSPYCTDIGQISQSVMLFISFIVLRFSKYKIVENKLMVKKDLNIKNQITRRDKDGNH